MTDQTAKKRENKVLRRNEYYAIQDVFDGLYAKSKQGAIFTDLMSLITSPQNIAIAYRRIKRNKGSRTPGTNMGTIEQIAERGNDILVDGGDGYRNIDIVSRDAYELIHTKDIARAKELIEKLLSEGLWNENALKKTNNYRILVGNTIIE